MRDDLVIMTSAKQDPQQLIIDQRQDSEQHQSIIRPTVSEPFELAPAHNIVHNSAY
jgi:hypothetical protein